MNNSYYRWVIVAAGGLLGCVAIGAMFSLPVFLLPISQDTGWSHTGVSGAMTIVLIGSAILVASLALASQASSLLQFQLFFGLLLGGASAAVFAPMMACVTG